MIRLEEYDAQWAVDFRKLRRRLSPLVPHARIEHIGSTAIPGCAAKPIIDVSVGLPPGARFGADEARAIGLELRSVRSYAAVFAWTNPGGRRFAHVHVRALGSEPELFDLRFRDYLRSHPDGVRAYVATKRRLLAARSGRAGYTLGKAPFIDGLRDRIRRWAEETGWFPDPSEGPPSGSSWRGRKGGRPLRQPEPSHGRTGSG